MPITIRHRNINFGTPKLDSLISLVFVTMKYSLYSVKNLVVEIEHFRERENVDRVCCT